MRIETLAKKLEERINFKLEELYKLGKEANFLIANKTDGYAEIYYEKMRSIARELRPVLYIIEFQSPQLKELFHELLKPKKRGRKKKNEYVASGE